MQDKSGADAVRQAAEEVQRVEAQKAEIKAAADEQMNERHDLQVECNNMALVPAENANTL